MASELDKKADFDFTVLFENLYSMKRQFWNYDRSQERFKKQLTKLHNSYFSKVVNPKGGSSLSKRKRA